MSESDRECSKPSVTNTCSNEQLHHPRPQILQPSSRPYKEERRILLSSVADSLTEVVRKMSKMNDRLLGTAEACKEVEDVASVWREALEGEVAGSTSSSAKDVVD